MKKVLATLVVALIFCSICKTRAKAITPEEIKNSEDIFIQVENIELSDNWYECRQIDENDSEEILMSYYIVTKEGETIETICERLQITEEYFLSENPQYNMNVDESFPINTYIAIPMIDWHVLENVCYIVQKGDCLSIISEYFFTTVEDVCDLNPKIKNPNMIYADSIVRVK